MNAPISLSERKAIDSGEFPGSEPQFFDGQWLDVLLEHCAGHDASDVTIQTEEPVRAHIQGRNVRITRRTLNANEVETITNAIYGSNGVTQIRKGEEIDTRHNV